MTFKQARQDARIIAGNTWAYIYQTKDKEWHADKNYAFRSDNWYYVHRDGRVLDHKKYNRWAKNRNGCYPFCQGIPNELYS